MAEVSSYLGLMTLSLGEECFLLFLSLHQANCWLLWIAGTDILLGSMEPDDSPWGVDQHGVIHCCVHHHSALITQQCNAEDVRDAVGTAADWALEMAKFCLLVNSDSPAIG